MNKTRASWLTVHKGDIDRYTSIEIIWKTNSNTLYLLMFRLSTGDGRQQLTTEETGPYHDIIELRQQIGVLFGEIAARRICRNPRSWLPPEQLELLTSRASARLRQADCAVVEKYQTSNPERENLPATIN